MNRPSPDPRPSPATRPGQSADPDPGHVPDRLFGSRFFPTPTRGEDTIYWDRCPADPAAPTSQDDVEPDRAGPGWLAVVWWRGRPAGSGRAVTAAPAATTSGTLTHHPGPAALDHGAPRDR